ncbi:SphA family protein [Cupriavidus sp. TMH.W2]|uniref:SphA family protein n=1 Tax=Cupriavidus sp. TMH.W2 TaxID=3434465 RepID=UPI003D77F3C3
MNTPRQALAVAANIAVLSLMPSTAGAYEFGSVGFAQPPGVDILDVGGSPPPGLYGGVGMNFSSRTATGPGAPTGGAEQITAVGLSPALNWVTPWTLFGGRYSVVAVQPLNYNNVGAPINLDRQGLHNTYVAPLNLSWALGDSGVFVKTFFSAFVPVGSISGPTGLGSVGVPWWTLQPGVVVSYLKDGWNLTFRSAVEFNTPNWKTGYKSGDVLHLNLVATKTFGPWTVGPIATYIGQISDDHSSSVYRGAINANRYNDTAVGGLVSYNFGPASAHLWFTKDIVVNASGGRAGRADPAIFAKGWSVFTSISFPFK